ncbi:MAG: hypothetical protein Q8R76_11330 [Candidatus Omnitrophota bacterium]|nr:hypothetical protein [Candidatus Omnitrophota bacterium]
MITINLLPEELRVVKTRTKEPVPWLKLAIGLGVLFVILTTYFFFGYLSARGKLKEASASWKVVEPQAVVLNDLEAEVEKVLSKEKQFLETTVTTERPLTNMLEWASQYLPSSAWLTQVKRRNDAEGNSIVITGLCLSTKEKTSIEQIEDYLHNLKTEIADAKLSLTTSRQIQYSVQVTHFVAVFEFIVPEAS